MIISRIRWAAILAACVFCASCATSRSHGDSDDSQSQQEQAAVVLTQLGAGYLRQGNYEMAMVKLKRALESNSRYAPAHSTIAVLYDELGQDEIALEHYKRAVQLTPDDPSALNNYGRYLCRHGKYKEAQKNFTKALADPLYSEKELLYANAGSCAQAQKDYERAEKFLRRALEINPRFPSALRDMAALMIETRNFMAARAYLQRYTEVAAHTAETLAMGIEVERELGDSGQVDKYIKQLKLEFRDSPEARKFME